MTWDAMASKLTLGAALLVVGCGLFGGESEGKNDPLAASGGAGGTPAAGGAGGGTSSACASTRGPNMVEVSTPGGVKYCIDRTEVTQAQYAEFLKAPGTTPGSEHADCKDLNATYQPENVPLDSQ